MSRNKIASYELAGSEQVGNFAGPIAPELFDSKHAPYAPLSLNSEPTGMDITESLKVCDSAIFECNSIDNYISLLRLAQKTLRYMFSQKTAKDILPGCFASADSNCKFITPELFDDLCQLVEQEEGIDSYAPWINVLRTIVFMSYVINPIGKHFINQGSVDSQTTHFQKLITSLVDGGILLEQELNLPNLRDKGILINCHIDAATAPVIFLMRLLGARVYVQPEKPIVIQTEYAQLFHDIGVTFHGNSDIAPEMKYPNIAHLFLKQPPPSDLYITWSCGNCHILRRVSRGEITTDLFIQQTDAKQLDSKLTCKKININAEEYKWRELEGTAKGIVDAAYNYAGVELGTAKDFSIAVVVGGKGRLGQQLVYELLLKDPNLHVLVMDLSTKPAGSVFLDNHRRITYFTDWGMLNDYSVGIFRQGESNSSSNATVYIALPTSTELDEQGLARFARHVGRAPHLIVGSHQVSGITPDLEKQFIIFNKGRMANFCKQRSRPTGLRYLDNVFKTIQFSMLHPSECGKLQAWLDKSNEQFDLKDLESAIASKILGVSSMILDRIKQRPGVSPNVLRKIKKASKDLEVKSREREINILDLHSPSDAKSPEALFARLILLDKLNNSSLGNDSL